MKIDIADLETIMVKYGLAIRAIPETVQGVVEAYHKDLFPDGRIVYLEEYKREMLVFESRPRNAGKFVIERVQNTDTRIQFQGKKFYNSIDEAVKDMLRKIEGRKK